MKTQEEHWELLLKRSEKYDKSQATLEKTLARIEESLDQLRLLRREPEHVESLMDASKKESRKQIRKLVKDNYDLI